VVSLRRISCVRILRCLAIWSVFTLTLPGLVGAQERPVARPDSANEKEILSIETLKNDAMQKGDAKVLEEIYADGLIFVNARGQLLTKQDRVKEFASGSVKYSSFRQGDYRFHIYGNTAVVTGLACSVVDYHGRVNQTPRRFTSVYVKLDGRWRFVAHQATLVSDDEPGDLQYCKN
jgi:ketosteroid isomerase-like protein